MRKIIKDNRIFPVDSTGRFLFFFALLFSFSVFAADGSEIPPDKDSMQYHSSVNIYIAEGTVVFNSAEIIIADKHIVSRKKEKSTPARSKILAKKEVKKKENLQPVKAKEPKARFQELPFTPSSFFTTGVGKNTMILPLTQNNKASLAINNKNTISYINSREDCGTTFQSSLFHNLEIIPGAFCTRPPPVFL
jgi:UDP:flavonoid glycosyltransferase YjiC (YdhE family)